MAVSILSVSVTPNETTVGQPITITIQAEETSWKRVYDSFDSWKDVRDSFSNWLEIQNWTV